MYIPRSAWTAVPPKSVKGADQIQGLNNYRTPVGVIVHSFPDSLTYFNNNPIELLEMNRHKDYTLLGYGDAQFNFAIPSNREGFYCLRGITSKTAANSTPELNRDYLSILCMIGLTEEPTDQLLTNLNDCLNYIGTKFESVQDVLPFSDVKPGGTSVPGEILTGLLKQNFWTLRGRAANTHRYLPPAPLPVGQINVHNFDLIEALSFYGYYFSRNDGLYGPLTQLAVRNLQQDLQDKRIYPKQIDGHYGRWTRDAWTALLARQ